MVILFACHCKKNKMCDSFLPLVSYPNERHFRNYWFPTIKNKVLQREGSAENLKVDFWQVSAYHYIFSSVELLNYGRLFATTLTTVRQASLSISNSRSLHKPMSIESVRPSNHFIFCRPLLPPSVFPSIRVFSNESVLRIRWPKYWSFSFSVNEYSGLISFRMDWLDLLALQETLKRLLQHHSSKASILRCSAFLV